MASSPEMAQRLHTIILDWYREYGRDLPWRRTRDPYRVLVSELMLQQTQVSRVIPKYPEFLQRFPTIADLAAAARADVVRAWAPLGYNLRAVRLHEIARQVVALRGGVLPTDPEQLLGLPGIGPYTAAAVACFAGERSVAVLDTNVRRVLGRIYHGHSSELSERQAWSLAETALPKGRAYDWNQALMDLGATICVAARPRCLLCPAQTLCCYATSEVAEAKPARRAAEERQVYRAEPFAGSSRYFRGRVVDALRGLLPGDWLVLGELAARLQPTAGAAEWLVSLALRLEADGLVEVERATTDTTSWRLRLA